MFAFLVWRSGARRRELIDRSMKHMGDGAAARGHHEVELDVVPSLALIERAYAAARHERLAHARATEMPDHAADVDPGAEAHVAVDRPVRLVEIERGVYPAATAAVEGQGVGDLVQVRRRLRF